MNTVPASRPLAARFGHNTFVIRSETPLSDPLRQTSCRLPFHADDPRQSDTTCKRINIRQSS
jgi:hypothetical protein